MRPKKQALAGPASAPGRRSRGKTGGGALSHASAATAVSAAIPSPAHRLQYALASEYEPETIRKWPPAATVGFVIVTCGGFWTGVGFLLSRLF